MPARRLHWQGETRQRALRERFDAALASWLGAWSAEPARLPPTPARADSTPLPRGLRWYRATGKAGSLWLGASPSALDSLGGLLAGARSDDGLGLGQRVGDRALRELLAQWLGGPANAGEIAQADAPSKQDLDPRYGSIRWRLGAGDLELHLLVDDALCGYLLPETKAGNTPLAARASSVTSEHVELAVVLDFGTATLAETHGLQVGDVLLSGTRLDTPFHLAHPDGRRLAGARLHRHDERRAIQLRAAAQDDKSK